MTDIEKVGVLGAGLMGHGIAQVSAQAGYDVVLREVDQGALDQGPGGSRGAARPRGREGEGRPPRTPTRSARASRARPTTRTSPTATSSSRRSSRTSTPKLEMWQELDAIVQPRRDLRLEHLVAVDHRPGRGDRRARPLRRAALLQPGPGDEARRGRADDRDVRRDVAGRRASSRTPLGKLPSRPATRAGFIVNRLLVPVPARRDPRLRGGRRHDRGDRRRHEGRLRAPDGPADARRLRRARHVGSIADVMFDEFRETRFAPPPLLRKMLAAGLVRQEVRPRLLRLLGRRAGPNPKRRADRR